MITFTEYGYTPANFVTLVASTGLSNAEFIRRNDMARTSFYHYKSGETSMRHQDWQALVLKYGARMRAD